VPTRGYPGAGERQPGTVPWVNVVSPWRGVAWRGVAWLDKMLARLSNMLTISLTIGGRGSCSGDSVWPSASGW
jgi:hypothetical protein